MFTYLSKRLFLALAFCTLPLVGCGYQHSAETQPQSTAGRVAMKYLSDSADACGTAEVPCALPELRVNGIAQD